LNNGSFARCVRGGYPAPRVLGGGLTRRLEPGRREPTRVGAPPACAREDEAKIACPHGLTPDSRTHKFRRGAANGRLALGVAVGRRVGGAAKKGNHTKMKQLHIVHLESGKHEPFETLRTLPDADRFGTDWVVVEWDDDEQDEELLLEFAAATGDDPKENAWHKLKQLSKTPRWSNLAGQILKHLDR
jgi:hypothetical protein